MYMTNMTNSTIVTDVILVGGIPTSLKNMKVNGDD